MITEKQIQKALRNAPASGKGAIELRDYGERGAGRLVIIVKPRTGRVTAEWYAVFFRRGMRAKAKLGSYPAMTVAEARLAFLTYYAPAIRAGDVPAVVSKRRESSAGTVGELFQIYRQPAAGRQALGEYGAQPPAFAKIRDGQGHGRRSAGGQYRPG